MHLSIFANRHHRITIKSSSSLRLWRHPKRTHPLQMAHRSIFCKLADHHHQLHATHQVDKQAIPHQLRNPFSEPTSDPSNNLAGFLFFNKSPFLVTEGDANIICQPYLSLLCNLSCQLKAFSSNSYLAIKFSTRHFCFDAIPRKSKEHFISFPKKNLSLGST